MIVIGAGAAGISAALELNDAGLSVLILEARDRIGGRIHTLRDSKFGMPVELGAEFIHGRPPELWELLKERKVQVHEVEGDNWCVEEGEGELKPCDFFSDVDKILGRMDDRKPDESFQAFLRGYSSKSAGKGAISLRDIRAQEWATSYVTGFNAADPALVGVHWLVQEMRAEEKIEGDRAFRPEYGYADVLEIFQRKLENSRVELRKNSIVEEIRWRRGLVEVRARGSNQDTTFSSPRVLITIPLGVLQARPDENGAVLFNPELLIQKKEAIRGVMMGEVIRITLRFRERFWDQLPKQPTESCKTLEGMNFLFSHDDWFPTWWTTLPHKLPFLVGWAPFHCARRLSGKSEAIVVEQGLKSIHRLLGVPISELEQLLEHADFHDWQSDPFSRGAYSYGKAGESSAQEALAEPIENTLFFAGEATDLTGNNGTVHGAIASGKRAAREILSAGAV